MSSPRQASPCEGVLEIHDRAVGPIRLPTDNADSFLRRFNAEYGGLGLAIIVPGSIAQEGNFPQSSDQRTTADTNASPPNAVSLQISRTLAATFCGSHGKLGSDLGRVSDGLLSLLDRVSLAAATRSVGGATTAAHIEQLTQSLHRGIQLVGGEAKSPEIRSETNPSTMMDEPRWQLMRQQLADAYHRFAAAIPALDLSNQPALAGCLGILADSAYQFGVLRQKLAFQRVE